MDVCHYMAYFFLQRWNTTAQLAVWRTRERTLAHIPHLARCTRLLVLKWETFSMRHDAPFQLALSKVSFPLNWSAVWDQGESRWAGAGSLMWLGSRPNVPYSAYPASQMDDDEVKAGGQRQVCSLGEWRGKGKRGRDCVCQYQEILLYMCQKQ